MASYLLSKYNENGSRLSSRDWINIKSVGSNINGKPLTLNEYLQVEDWYLNFFEELITLYKVSEFVLPWYEDNRFYISSKFKDVDFFTNINNPWVAYVAGQKYSIDNWKDLMRLGLRQLLNFEINFGAFFVVNFDDMYFYIEIDTSTDITILANKNNLTLVDFDKYIPQEPVFLEDV